MLMGGFSANSTYPSLDFTYPLGFCIDILIGAKYDGGLFIPVQAQVLRKALKRIMQVTFDNA